MIVANNSEQVADNLLDLLIDELNTENTPSALIAVHKNEDGSLRVRVNGVSRPKWYSIVIVEYDPTIRPKGVPVRLLPGGKGDL